MRRTLLHNALHHAENWIIRPQETHQNDGTDGIFASQILITAMENLISPDAAGLVLEGGGMRGIYTAGVLDVFFENTISFDAQVGVSAGAIHGASFRSCQPGRSIKLYLAYSPSPQMWGFGAWLRTGSFIDAKFSYGKLCETILPLDFDAYENAKGKFYITCTDIETGRAYYHDSKTLRGEEMKALQASASLPLVSKPVEFNGRKLLDGGTADSIPIEFMQNLGYKKLVLVLTQVAGYRKKSEHPEIFKLLYRKYPEFIQSVLSRPDRYNATLDLIADLEKKGEIIVLRPSVKIPIKRVERDARKILDMYELGRRDALAKLSDIRSYIAKVPASFEAADNPVCSAAYPS